MHIRINNYKIPLLYVSKHLEQKIVFCYTIVASNKIVDIYVTLFVENMYDFNGIKSVLNLQMTYIIIAHIYEQWDR